jgi:hypothetical protein
MAASRPVAEVPVGGAAATVSVDLLNGLSDASDIPPPAHPVIGNVELQARNAASKLRRPLRITVIARPLIFHTHDIIRCEFPELPVLLVGNLRWMARFSVEAIVGSRFCSVMVWITRVWGNGLSPTIDNRSDPEDRFNPSSPNKRIYHYRATVAGGCQINRLTSHPLSRWTRYQAILVWAMLPTNRG